MDGSGVFGPASFQDYATQHGYNSSRKTCELISKDSIESLPDELREAQAMVLRLGVASDGRGTAFVLVKVSNLSDFFLIHEKIFTNEEVRFDPFVHEANLLAFQSLPKLTETSLVNLALASGVLGTALQIDDPTRIPLPATGQSTYSFVFQPHEDIWVQLKHDRGQVEIDALFFAKRGGITCLFLIEAKTGTGRRSLAKHKLVYPLLALRPEIPITIPIVPVYMHAERTTSGYRFRIAECVLRLEFNKASVLSDLQVVSNRTFLLPGLNARKRD